ncbi:MAG: HEAT repeat domain-containing protein [Candidatus Heimdallarchaeota archaeon]
MSNRLRKVLRINKLMLTLLLATSIISMTFVMGLSDIDKSVRIEHGYDEAYIYTVENYKNQRFALEVEFDATVSIDYVLYVFCVPREEWNRVEENGTLHINDIPAENFLFNATVTKLVDLLDTDNVIIDLIGEDIVIPDWEPWTFVFLNLNGEDLTTNVMVKHQHILWWLWIVLPTLVIAGLTTYGVAGNLTKYERAKMTSEKAISKLGIKNEAERQRAAYWLISNGTEEDLIHLKDLLHNDNPLSRANSAFAIGGISKRIGDKSLAAVLIDRYNMETDEMVKEEIVNGLCDVADDSSLKILEKYLTIDHNEILRFNIAEALEDIASHKSIPTLVETINGSNTETLKIACRRALEKIAKIEGSTAAALIKKHTK